MNDMTMHARLDADIAAILGLEEAFFLPLQPARARTPRGRALAVVAAIAVGVIGTAVFVLLPSSTPVAMRALDVTSRRSLPSHNAAVTRVSPPGASLEPAVRLGDALPLARSAGPTIKAVMPSAKRASGTTRKPTSNPVVPVLPAEVEPPLTSSLASHQGPSRVLQSADKSAAIILPVSLAEEAIEPGPALKRAARATERRNAIDAIRALRR